MKLGLALALLLAPQMADPHTIRGERSYLSGWPAANADASVNLVVEIPAGTTDEWRVDPASGLLRWAKRYGELPSFRYVPAPWNYGMVPSTRDPDGEALDALVLAPALERGAVVRVKPIGLLQLVVDGERDAVLIAVPTRGALSELSDASELGARYPGVDDLLRIWFAFHRGRGPIMVKDLLGAESARRRLGEAARAFGAARKP